MILNMAVIASLFLPLGYNENLAIGYIYEVIASLFLPLGYNSLLLQLFTTPVIASLFLPLGYNYMTAKFCKIYGYSFPFFTTRL